MDRAPSKVLSHMAEIEEMAEDVLADRQQIIALDRKRNKTREAIRALNKETSNKSWVCFGDMFIKLPTPKAKTLLEKDFNNLDEEINDVRSQLKPKVNKLRDLENKDGLKGFHLNPLSQDERRALGDVL